MTLPLELPNEREYVLFTREISQESMNELIDALMNAANSSSETYLLLNCGGGNVMAGIYAYNMMRALPTKLIVHNVGSVNSVANVLFLAADTRYSTPPSTFMFHGVAFNRQGPLKLDERYLKEYLDSVVADHDRIGKIISDRSHLTPSEVSELFSEQRVRDVDWALDRGVIHEIVDLKIPPDASIRQLI